MSALTRTGLPRIGAKIDVQCTDDSWRTVKIVGRASGKHIYDVKAIQIEDSDADGSWYDWVPWGERNGGIVWREHA